MSPGYLTLDSQLMKKEKKSIILIGIDIGNLSKIKIKLT